MPALNFTMPYRPAFDSNAIPIPGAMAYFSYTGTTTPAPIYTDPGISIPASNPLEANGAGRFPQTFLDDSITYRLRIFRPGDNPAVANPVEEYDPYEPQEGGAIGPRGPNGYSVQTLAQLKAAPITDGPLSYDEAVFTFKTDQNYTTLWDDDIYVESDEGGTGAWVRQDASKISALASYTQSRVRPQQSKNDDVISLKDFGAVGDGIADDTDAFEAALANFALLNSYEQAKALYLPGGIYRLTRGLIISLVHSSLTIWSDSKATLMVNDLDDGEWAIDVDYSTGGTANFATFNMTNIAISDTAATFTKNGLRTQRVIASKFTQCEFNYLNDATDQYDDSNLNTFDTCMWRGNNRGWFSSGGVANNNVWLNCQWRNHLGTAFDSRGTGGNIITGGDMEPDNATPVIIAEHMEAIALRFERNGENEETGIQALDGNRLDIEVFSDGGSQLIPVVSIEGDDNEIKIKGGSGAAAIVRAGAKRNLTELRSFDTTISPGTAIYYCEDGEPSNILKVRSSAQGNSATIVEAVKSELVPGDLTLWTATDCTVTAISGGGQRVEITGAAPSLTFTPAAGAYSNIKIAVAATSSTAASQPILAISGGPSTIDTLLSNGWPSNHLARKVYTTKPDLVWTNPTFTIYPAAVAGGSTFEIYNLRTALGAIPE